MHQQEEIVYQIGLVGVIMTLDTRSGRHKEEVSVGRVPMHKGRIESRVLEDATTWL